MVNAIVNVLSDKEFLFLSEISSESGRQMLLSALRAEINMSRELVMDYPTPELRKINAKVSRGREVSAEELVALNGSSAVFQGRTQKGLSFENPVTLSFWETYLSQLPLYKRNLEKVGSVAGEEDTAEKLFLGVPVARLRSNSIFFSNFIKENLHVYSQEITDFLKELIEEIIDLKNGVGKTTYRLSVDDVQAPLLQAGVPYDQVLEMHAKSAGVALQEKDVPRAKEIFLKVLFEASNVDNLMQANKELTSSFDLLHDKYTVFFLHYFYNFLREPVKSKIRVSHNTLITFYRKGVELCGNL